MSLGPRCFDARRSLGQVEKWLTGQLNERRYKWKLFVVPNGFAIATAFERIDDHGRMIYPSPADHRRWQTGPFDNSLWDVFTGEAKPGRYRAFLFVFAPNFREEALARPFPSTVILFESNPYRLPTSLAEMPAGPDKHLQLFVYEFERRTLGGAAVPVSNLSAAVHLSAARLGALNGGKCP